jgi:hypothetical protein
MKFSFGLARCCFNGFRRVCAAAQLSVGGRTEYFDDRGALFSGTTPGLEEFTLAMDHILAPGLLARTGYRRDFSNQRSFLTDRAGVPGAVQSTTTPGLVYWWEQGEAVGKRRLPCSI